MAITAADLAFYKAERETDFSDGGGRQSGNIILTNEKNAVFDDITDQDRASGGISIRKVFAAVISENADPYLDAGVAIIKAPADPAVSVLALSTGDFYDQRTDIEATLEETITRGPRYNGWLWGQHISGQRALLIWQRLGVPLPSVGTRLDVVAMGGINNLTEEYDQFVWITRVSSTIMTLTDTQGPYDILQVTCELAEKLTANYLGIEPSRIDVYVAPPSIIYSTVYNSNSVAIYGIQALTAEASISDYSVQVADLYTPIIPTSQQETALADTTPGGNLETLVGANATAITFTTTTHCIAPSLSLFLGTGAMPSSVGIAIGSSTLTDDGSGNMRLGGTQVGTINYGTGVITWTAGVPDYTTQSKTVTFIPAGAPTAIADTAALFVTLENRGYVWVVTLAPIPAPATLEIRYLVNSQWYVLRDKGAGLCTGSNSAYGSANLNFTTGTVTLTTGELPDVSSAILFSWGTPTNYVAQGGTSAPLTIRGVVAHPGIVPGTFSIAWPTGHSLTADDTGALSGAAGTGQVDVALGAWWLQPALVPAASTVFTINYDYTPTDSQYTQSGEHSIDPGDSLVHVTLAHGNVLQHTVKITWPILIPDYSGVTSTPIDMILASAINTPKTKTATDDDAGVTVSYSEGTLTFDPAVSLPVQKPTYSLSAQGLTEATGYSTSFVPAHSGSYPTNQTVGTAHVIDFYRTMVAGIDTQNVVATLDLTRNVVIKYQVDSTPTTAAPETVTLTQIELQLPKQYADTLVPGTTRFHFGGSSYVDLGGSLYRDPSPTTGSGTLAGTLDPASGIAYLTGWTAGGSNSVAVDATLTLLAGHPVDAAVFATLVAPIRPGTLQLRATMLTGTSLSKTVDSSGKLVDSDCTILVDALTGVVRAHFGSWATVSGLLDSEKSEPWYDVDLIITIDGVDKIWRPKLVLAETIVYNAVGLTFLPPDSQLLGIDAARLPIDGKGLMLDAGRLALVHNTQAHSESSLSPTQVVDMGRTRLYRVVVEDSTGKRVAPSQYTVDRAAGTVTMSAVLDLTGYTAPYSFLHMIADEGRLRSVDISGRITFNKPMSHTYPADTSFCSTILPIGTMQARVSHLFEQSVWTNVWSDSLIGNAPLAQYNNAEWPVVITNQGAYTDRILVQFTSSSAFNVIGQNLGFIAVGTINEDCSPLNTLTGIPYFKIPSDGWGIGWATGNCLRFNVIGANWPVDLVRAVQPSDPTDPSTDSVELLLLGNVNV